MKTTKRKSKTVAKVAEPVAEAAPEISRPTVSVINLSSHCTIKDAAKLKVDLCALANEGTAVELDVSAVERIDTATMQLLCAFARDRAQRNQKVIWKGNSQSWREAVRLLGAGELLGYAG
jgi:ABC-type transporter Mla MlaB component